MARENNSGFDAPAVLGHDLLNREEFAYRLYQLAISTPQTWSIRMGLHGRWGEGKTTILNFIAGYAENDGNIVVRLNPWVVNDPNELWGYFLVELFLALDEKGISIGKANWRAKFARTHKSKKYINKLSEAFPKFAGLTSLVYIGIEQLLDPSGEILSALNEKLQDRRLFIFIDDLDRAKPVILPDLFLALRDKLDVPKFVYFLAFDDDIIAKALVHERKAIPDGNEFLEKLLDFSFRIPEISTSQRVKFLETEFQKNCPFADLEAVTSIQDLLPSSPRKLKRLVRYIAPLQNQIERHGDDEISWPILYICQLIRLDSENFFAQFLRSIEDNNVGWASILMTEKDKNEKFEKNINELFEKSDIKTTDQKNYLRELCAQLLRQVTLRDFSTIKYNAHLWFKPHAITRKEFRILFDDWRENSAEFDLNGWVLEQANRTHHSTARVSDELFETAHNCRTRYLERAAGARLVDEHSSLVDMARAALNLTVRLYLSGLDCVGADYFRTAHFFNWIYGISKKWGHFDAQQADRDLRKDEEKAIQECVNSCMKDPEEFIKQNKPWFSADPFPETRDRLWKLCYPQIEQQIVARVVERFKIPDSISKLMDEQSAFAERYVLFSKESPFWVGHLSERLLQILQMDQKHHEIQNNAYWFIHLLDTYVIEYHGDQSDEFRKWLLEQQPDSILAIWNTAVRSPIQYRHRQELRDARQRIISAGLPEAKIPMPKWLEPE